MLLGKLRAIVLFEHQCFAGFEGEHSDPSSRAGFERLRADAGDIEAQIVFFTGDFDSHRATVLPGEFAAAREAFVRALKALDGEHRAVFDDHNLADLKAGDFLGDAKAKCHVLQLVRGELRTETETAGGHQWFEPRNGFDEFDPVFFQFVGDRTKNGVGVPFFDFEEERHRPQVGTEIEKIFGSDLPDHDALMNIAAGEGGNHLGKLADLEPDDFVHQRGQCGIGLSIKRDGDKAFDTQCAGLPGENQWQETIAGNHSQGVELSHASWLRLPFSGMKKTCLIFCRYCPRLGQTAGFVNWRVLREARICKIQQNSDVMVCKLLETREFAEVCVNEIRNNDFWAALPRLNFNGMKTQAQQLTHLDTSSVWKSDIAGEKASKKSLPGIKLVTTVATVALVLAAGLSIRLYWAGKRTLQALAEQLNGNTAAADALHQTRGWAWQMAEAAVGGAVGLFLVTLACGWWLRWRWSKRHVTTVSELEKNTSRLMSKLAESKVLEDEAQRQRIDLEARLHNISQTYAALERDLDARKQAERDLALQAQQLERSKDVLELHVQARTQEMHKMQRRTEMILNSAGEGICSFDLQGRATFVNPAAAKITGWKADELIGKSEEIIFFPAKPKAAKGGSSLAMDGRGNILPEQIFLPEERGHFSRGIPAHTD